jgi:hypothetical protein
MTFSSSFAKSNGAETGAKGEIVDGVQGDATYCHGLERTWRRSQIESRAYR